MQSSPHGSAGRPEIASENDAVTDLSDQMGNMGAEPKVDIDEKTPGEEAIIEELAAFLIARNGHSRGVKGCTAEYHDQYAREKLKVDWRPRLLNTFQNSGPPFCGPRQGTNARIDVVVAPIDFKNCKKQYRVLEKSGQRPQLTQYTPPRPFDDDPSVGFTEAFTEGVRQLRRLQLARPYKKRNCRTIAPKPDKQMWRIYTRQEGAKHGY